MTMPLFVQMICLYAEQQTARGSSSWQTTSRYPLLEKAVSTRFPFGVPSASQYMPLASCSSELNLRRGCIPRSQPSPCLLSRQEPLVRDGDFTSKGIVGQMPVSEYSSPPEGTSHSCRETYSDFSIELKRSANTSHQYLPHLLTSI